MTNEFANLAAVTKSLINYTPLPSLRFSLICKRNQEMMQRKYANKSLN